MYVCLCHGVTDGQIREAITAEGCCSFREVRNTLGVATQCGKCACAARDLIRETLNGNCSLQNASSTPCPMSLA